MSGGGLFGSAVLDVAVGLVFIYLLLAIFCTAINEWLAGVFKTRGKLLAQGIAELLNGQAGTHKGQADTVTGFLQDFYGHPLISGLQRGEAHPAYIPARTFASVLIDLVTSHKPGVLTFDDLEKGLNDLPEGEVRRALLALMQDTERDLDTARKRIEAWYDDAMDRVTGWYKRYTQVWTIIVALLIAVSINADTLQIARRLWTDPTLRSQIVEQAKVRAAQPQPSTSAPSQPAANSAGTTVSRDEQALLGQVLGWHPDALRGNTPLDWLERVIGWLLSVVAISLGAPFWFDILNRFMNIRSAGRSPDETAKKPEKKKMPPEDKAA